MCAGLAVAAAIAEFIFVFMFHIRFSFIGGFLDLYCKKRKYSKFFVVVLYVSHTHKTYAIEDLLDYDPMTSASGKWNMSASNATISYSSNGVSISVSGTGTDPVFAYQGTLPSEFEVEITYDFGSGGEEFAQLNGYYVSRGSYSSQSRLMIYNTWLPNYYVNHNTFADGTYIIQYKSSTIYLLDSSRNVQGSYAISNPQSTAFALYVARNHTVIIKDVKIKPSS